jgi:protein ImuB
VELTVARLANLVGDSNIGSPELLDTHQPEGFRMRRFIPNRDSVGTRRSLRRTPGSNDAAATEIIENSSDKDFKTAFRVFRPALPARVEVRKGCPVQVAFPGIRGRVVAASGPWRGSGDWWREEAWQSDEWDIEIQFDALPNSRLPAQITNTNAKESPTRGVYRLLYDATCKEWFVRGAYD